jgi:hypothetical protein
MSVSVSFQNALEKSVSNQTMTKSCTTSNYLVIIFANVIKFKTVKVRLSVKAETVTSTF